MKSFNRLTALVATSVTAAALLLGASALPAAAQQAPVYADPVYAAPAPQPQVVDPNYAQQQVVAAIPGCPVPAYQLRDVLSGMYGVDGLYRPVNQFGFPVDVYGNCLTQAPVAEIFNYQPSGIYVNTLWLHFGYRYTYNPSYVRLYSGPGVHVYSGYGAVPYGHTSVVIQNNYRPVVRTPGVSVSPVVRAPALPSVGAPVVRAPVVAAPAVSAPVVRAPAVAAPAYHPAAAPAAAPVRVAPPRSSAPSVFIRRH